jgi:MFS family permease
VVPTVEREQATRWPDAIGGALLVLAIGALAYGLVEVPSVGWHAPATTTSWIIAAVALVMFVWRSARHPSPVVDLAMLCHGPFAWSNIAVLLTSVAFAIELLSLVLLFQQQWHWSALKTGFAIAPGPCMVPIFALLGQRLAHKIRVGVVAAIGAAMIGIGAIAFVMLVGGTSPAYVTGALPAWMAVGMGVGLAFPSMFAAATACLPAERASTGSAVINMARQLGFVLGTSILVALAGLSTAPNPLRDGWWFAAAVAAIGALAALRITPRGART